MGYVLRFVNADSLQSLPAYPIHRVFANKNAAEEFVKTQPGYGLNIDWFVEGWQVDER